MADINFTGISKLGREAGIIVDTNIILVADVPMDIVDFYVDLGCPFIDSKTGQKIRTLAPYQIRTIKNHLKHKKLLVLKSQKIGLSSLGIVITLWHALTDCMGFDIIIMAQSMDKAIQHGKDLKRMLLESRYKDYLIQRPKDVKGLMKDEITKATEVYMHNRHDPNRPTHIYILPPSATQIASLKRVKFIWVSDITVIQSTSQNQQLVFLAMMSRIILTEGPVFIECPCVGTLGPVYQLDKAFQDRQKSGEPPGEFDFYVDRIKVQEAVDAGLMTAEAVESLRRDHGTMFGPLFEADWHSGDNAWYMESMFDHDEQVTEWMNN